MLLTVSCKSIYCSDDKLSIWDAIYIIGWTFSTFRLLLILNSDYLYWPIEPLTPLGWLYLLRCLTWFYYCSDCTDDPLYESSVPIESSSMIAGRRIWLSSMFSSILIYSTLYYSAPSPSEFLGCLLLKIKSTFIDSIISSSFSLFFIALSSLLRYLSNSMSESDATS